LWNLVSIQKGKLWDLIFFQKGFPFKSIEKKSFFQLDFLPVPELPPNLGDLLEVDTQKIPRNSLVGG